MRLSQFRRRRFCDEKFSPIRVGANLCEKFLFLIESRRDIIAAVSPNPLFFPPNPARTAMLTVTFLGHAAFLFSDGENTLAVDPFLSDNPAAKRGPDEVSCQHIALTHGHADHVGDTVAVARRNDAVLIAPYELAIHLERRGVKKIEPANPGGKIQTPFGFVAFTRADHSAALQNENGEWEYMGLACGLVVRMGDKTAYLAGDTGIFFDMKLIGEIYQPDLALFPIGDRFTMGPELAARAAEMVAAPLAVPYHYNTMPLIMQDPADFKPRGVAVKILQPEESLSLE